MHWSYRIAAFNGIDLRVHITFPLIIVYAVYTGSQTFGLPWQGALFGVVSILLLFVCVALHELAHSLQAVAVGIGVRSITLLPIGGVSQLADRPDRPKDEFRISVAGPIASLAVALVFFAIILAGLASGNIHGWTHLVRSITQPGWVGLVAYLFVANVILAVFNLIPAYPMDGGRILKSLLSLWLGPLLAAQIATVVGRVLAVLMGLAGIFLANLSLVLISFFVYMGASFEDRAVQTQRRLNGMLVSDVLVPVEVVFAHDLPLSTALDLARHSRQQEFPVARNDTWVGIATALDLSKAVQSRPPDTAVAALMHEDFPILSPSATLLDVAKAIQHNPARAAAIRHGEEFLGLIGEVDLQRAIHLLEKQSRGRIRR
jgi:Zn-dependent protease/predicted transcriptional regulator